MSGNGEQGPKSWETLTFDQAIEPITDEGKRVDRSDYVSEGALPVIDQGEEFIGGYTNDISKRYSGPLPVIVFGDHTRRVKLVDFAFVVGAQGVKLLRPKDRWEPRFLAYLLPTVPLPDRGYGRHYQYLRQLKFSCPPRPLQRQIVAEIEKQFTRLEAGVAGLRRVQANLKRYRAAVLKAACEGKLVPTEAELARQEGRSYETGTQLLDRILNERHQEWNEKGKYKEPKKPETSMLAELPEGWTWGTAEQICRFITKGTTPRADKLQSGSGDVQFLKVYNLTFTGYLDYHYKPVFISRKTHDTELTRSKVKSGDVLINIVGPPLGQVAVVPEDLAEANINQAIARFSPLDGVSNHFLSIAFQSKSVMRWAIDRAKTTAGQANVTLELCRMLPVPLPPLAEQQRIVADVESRLSVAEELEAVMNNNLRRTTRLRESVLKHAFEGELVRIRGRAE